MTAIVVASLSTAAMAAFVVHAVTPPPRRLERRVAPYLMPATAQVARQHRGGPIGQIFGPLIEHAALALSNLIDRRGLDHLLMRLRQAGWSGDESDEKALSSYRLAQLRSAVAATSLGALVGVVMGLAVPSIVALGVLGLVIGMSRQRGQLEKAIETRSNRMRIEIYTVNQLLAMRVRAGGGVMHSIQSIVARGDGEVVDELAQALRLHRSGWRASDALRRIAELTPEPFCSRTYRLLAAADKRGTDLAASLLALSEDVRETRREAIKRSATKRRAAMLVPTIAILAPVLILFVAAPLPFLIAGWQ